MATLEVSVAAGVDDGYFIAGGTFYPIAATLRFGYSPGNTFSSFMRFADVTIPPGTTITSAYLEVESQGVPYASLGNVTDWIKAVDEDDSAAITSEADWNGRAKTSASINWEPGAWVSNTTYQSPDIVAIIQEVIDRGGWASGNALQLLWKGQISGSGLCAFDSYESAGATPLLHIEYTIPNDPPTAPTWDAPANGSSQNVIASLLLDWTFNDPDVGDTQSAYTLRRTIDATVVYWNGAGWQAGEDASTKIASTVESHTLATSWGSSSDADHYYVVKTWDDADAGPSPWSASLQIVPITAFVETLAVNIIATITSSDGFVFTEALTVNIVSNLNGVDVASFVDPTTITITSTVSGLDTAIFVEALILPIVATIAVWDRVNPTIYDETGGAIAVVSIVVGVDSLRAADSLTMFITSTINGSDAWWSSAVDSGTGLGEAEDHDQLGGSTILSKTGKASSQNLLGRAG